MSIVSIISFLGVAVILTLMPGPDILFILAQSITKGKKAGIMTSLGLCTGLIVHITAATVGISAIVYQSTVVFNIVKYAGAAYLLYLAYKSFTDKESSIKLDVVNSLEYKSLYKRGIIMNILNPKVALFFLALFPQFINYSVGYVPLQMICYGIIFILQTLIIFSLVSAFSDKIGHYLRKSPKINKKINIVQGSIFVLIGISIAFETKS